MASLVTHTGYGVDVFFALSGYLVCTLLLNENKLTSRIDLKSFYTRRAFRILPITAAYLTVIWSLHCLGRLPGIQGSEVFAVLGFARNYVSGSWYTGHFWSLAIEEHFYLLTPLLLMALRWKQALRVCIGIALATIVIRAFEFHFWSLSVSPLQFRTENRFDGLMWGAVLALLLQNDRIRTWMTNRLNWKAVLFLLITGSAGMILLDGQPWRRSIAALVLPILIAYTVLRPNSGLSKVLELGWIRWIGRLSYSLYVLQSLFLPEADRPLGAVQRFPLALAMAFACAVASYYLLEQPLIRVGRRVTNRMRSGSQRLDHALS